jgi:hypothetical protein
VFRHHPNRGLMRRHRRYCALVAPDPTDLDLAVYSLVKEELAPYGEHAAAADLTWGEKAEMWFTEVRPTNAASAKISIAVDDPDTITVTVGNIWFEMFGSVTESLVELREIVAGVLVGRLEEAGSPQCAFGRVSTSSRTYRFGHAHAPLPWKWRRARRYDAYGPVR